MNAFSLSVSHLACGGTLFYQLLFFNVGREKVLTVRKQEEEGYAKYHSNEALNKEDPKLTLARWKSRKVSTRTIAIRTTRLLQIRH